jgi:hypothetical protein
MSVLGAAPTSAAGVRPASSPTSRVMCAWSA